MASMTHYPAALLSLLIFGAFTFPSTAAGHGTKPDLRRTLEYIAANIETGVLFESNDCSIKMVDVQSIGGTEPGPRTVLETVVIRFSLSHIDLSRGDTDTPGVATASSQMAIYIPRKHVAREDQRAWSLDQVYLNTPNKRLARALSHAATLCGAKATPDPSPK
jgi:hypothetical protein